MDKTEETYLYSEQLAGLKGVLIAIVYTFEGEDANGFEHYDVWRMDVVGDWLRAVEEIGAIPYIMDVRTFGQKALNNTLPCIDYVINLNAGNIELSTLTLVPSICAFKGLTCLPCDAFISVVGEHKIFSNIIAADAGLKIPLPSKHGGQSIKKPVSMGSSAGVRKYSGPDISTGKEFSQEFIAGIDLSTPLLFNPHKQRMIASQSVAYITEPFNPEWFLSADEKSGNSSYIKVSARISESTRNAFAELAAKFGIKTLCRVDARVRSDSEEEIQEFLRTEIPDDRIHFIEINPMPTIRSGINFCNAIVSEAPENEFAEPLRLYNDIISKPTVVGFILSSAILGHIHG